MYGVCQMGFDANCWPRADSRPAFSDELRGLEFRRVISQLDVSRNCENIPFPSQRSGFHGEDCVPPFAAAVV